MVEKNFDGCIDPDSGALILVDVHDGGDGNAHIDDGLDFMLFRAESDDFSRPRPRGRRCLPRGVQPDGIRVDGDFYFRFIRRGDRDQQFFANPAIMSAVRTDDPLPGKNIFMVEIMDLTV